MIRIKSIILLALAMVCTVGAQAKSEKDDADEMSALQESLAQMIHKYSSGADTLAKELSARFRHNAKIQTAIARAYYRNQDREHTAMYLDRAIAINPKYADPYIMYGSMYDGTTALHAWSADSAAYWYNKAIAVDQKRPDAYLGLATAQSFLKDDLAASKATLERLRAANPSYDVDAAIADLYNRQGNDSLAASSFASSDPYKLDMNHMAKYVQNLYWSRQFDKAAEVAKIATERFPQNKSFCRVCAWSLVNLGAYTDALKYGNEWMSSAPADSLNSIDMFAVGSANIALGNIDKGFDYYAKITKMDDYFVPQMKQQIVQLVRKVTDEFCDKKEYDKAATVYKKFMDTYPGGDEAYKYYVLSDIYRSQMLQYEGDARKPYLEKLFAVYDEMESRFPDWENMYYIMYQHAQLTYTILDPDNEKCLAQPYYQKVYDYLSKQSNFDQNKTNIAVNTCLYLGSTEYFQHNNLKQARVWWNRALMYDPSNQQAKTALEKIK